MLIQHHKYNLQRHCLSYSELSCDQLYQFLQLRAAVFVLEQQCFYQDLDGCDQQAHHLMLYEGEALTAYGRIFGPGGYRDTKRYSDCAIGRLLVDANYRGCGMGKFLLEQCLAFCQQAWPQNAVWLLAQAHLVALYQSAGFVAQGEPYDEDGILHIDMLRGAFPE